MNFPAPHFSCGRTGKSAKLAVTQPASPPGACDPETPDGSWSGGPRGVVHNEFPAQIRPPSWGAYNPGGLFALRMPPGIEMLAEVGHPFAAAQARVFPWQPRQAAPARPLAEQRNWASVCVSWDPYLVAI